MCPKITGALLFSASIAFSVISTTVLTKRSANATQIDKKKSASVDARSFASKNEQPISVTKPVSCESIPLEASTIENVVVGDMGKSINDKVQNVVPEQVVITVSETSIEEPVKKTEKAVSSTKKAANNFAPALSKAKVDIVAPVIVDRPEASFSGSASVDLSASIDVEEDAPW